MDWDRESASAGPGPRGSRAAELPRGRKETGYDFWRAFAAASASSRSAADVGACPRPALDSELLQNICEYPSPAHSYGGALPLRCSRQLPTVCVLSSRVWRQRGPCRPRAMPSFHRLVRDVDPIEPRPDSSPEYTSHR